MKTIVLMFDLQIVKHIIIVLPINIEKAQYDAGQSYCGFIL